MLHSSRVFATVALFGFVSFPVASAEPASIPSQTPHQVRRATSAIDLDGALTESTWSTALQIDLNYEVRPGENTEPPVRTQCLVTYDDRFVYVGFRAFDPDPTKIRARYSDRDQAWDDDWVGIVLDTFNDQRRAYELFSTPLGVQIDAIRDDVGDKYDDSWNAIWKSAGRITDEGYEVEMAIPFNQIRFQSTDGAQTWGFDAVRLYPRDQRHQLGAFARDKDNNSYLSQTLKLVGMEGASPGRNLEIAPTLTGSRTDTRTSLPDGALQSGDPSSDLGLSLRWGITPNVSLNGAYNPDFSNIEADELQLNVNTQFALFFRETRPFFLEGADYFNTGLNLVHTRTVADPSSAAKLTGKTGRHTWGVFGAQDDVTQILLPAAEGSSSGSFSTSNLASVARYRYDFGANSTIGGALTDRRGSGYANTVFSADTVIRISEKDTIRASVAASETEYNTEMISTLGAPVGSLTDEAIKVDYDHGERGWWILANYSDFGDGFRSDSGFRPRVGLRSLNASGAKVWWPDQGSFVNRAAWGASIDHTEQQNGALLDEGVSSWFNIQGPRASFMSIFASASDRVFASVPFDVWSVDLDYNVQATANMRLGVNATFGDWIDFNHVQPAERMTIRPSVRYMFGRHLSLDLAHIYSLLDVAGGRLFRIHAPEVRVVQQFNAKTFVRLVLQYTDIQRDPTLYTSVVDANTQTLLSQFLFSYKISPQTALYAGYTDNQLGTDTYDLTRTDRTFFLKLGYAWVR
jgi:hypothetical protein